MGMLAFLWIMTNYESDMNKNVVKKFWSLINFCQIGTCVILYLYSFKFLGWFLDEPICKAENFKILEIFACINLVDQISEINICLACKI